MPTAPGGRARGGHPEHREAGGGWGALGGPAQGRAADGEAEAGGAGAGRAPVRGGLPGPRREYLEAFDSSEGDDPPGTVGPGEDDGERAEPEPAPGGGAGRADDDVSPGAGRVARVRGGRGAGPAGGRGRTFTGIAAAAVTTVLAVVVAGQVTAESKDAEARPSSGATERAEGGEASRSDGRPTPAPPPPPPSYEEKLALKYPLSPTLKGPGGFTTVPGRDKAPGRGEVVRYRVDVERGLPLEAQLFARAVHKTLNDERSWGRGGKRTFERVSSGDARFVISLASPGTTATWCAKSGLDTTQDNVSCDSAATERIMINAYRWAQGAKTFRDDQTVLYRQMLINHEVGHRLGRDHEGCPRDGALAPVMMQQTKLLHTGNATCRVNAWPYPDEEDEARR
ncbi:DUF3152 domain-containing protein [Streptomyces sp. NPDC057702]|uniref:DUF3152 domain-containing protein n=1 Tax=unclassified Streptomyces TaxID=2593676 RepID=UPI003698DC63